MPEWKIVEAPSPEISYDECAIAHLLAFSDANYWHWCASDASYIVMNTADDIPKQRLRKTSRWVKRAEIDRRRKVVCAVLDGKVIGISTWNMPVGLSKKETWGGHLYRKAIGIKDRIDDWLFPKFWLHKKRFADLMSIQTAVGKKLLGPSGTDGVWELYSLAILPEFQRQGVGAALVDWGMDQAQRTGTSFYVIASPLGKGLYEKKGFSVLDELHMKDGEWNINEWFYLWKPEVAGDGDKLEQGKC